MMLLFLAVTVVTVARQGATLLLKVVFVVTRAVQPFLTERI